MRIVIATSEFLAVGFRIPVAEFLTPRDLARHPELARLGPDLLAEDFDENDALARLRSRPDADIGDALLDQRLVAGIGNVFKSEILFVCGISPFRKVGTLTDEELRSVVVRSRELMRANVIDPSRSKVMTFRGYRRTTRRADPAARLWVYGRGGRPCRNCGTPIDYRKQGPDARGTYWCPHCQR